MCKVSQPKKSNFREKGNLRSQLRKNQIKKHQKGNLFIKKRKSVLQIQKIFLRTMENKLLNLYMMKGEK